MKISMAFLLVVLALCFTQEITWAQTSPNTITLEDQFGEFEAQFLEDFKKQDLSFVIPVATCYLQVKDKKKFSYEFYTSCGEELEFEDGEDNEIIWPIGLINSIKPYEVNDDYPPVGIHLKNGKIIDRIFPYWENLSLHGEAKFSQNLFLDSTLKIPWKNVDQLTVKLIPLISTLSPKHIVFMELSFKSFPISVRVTNIYSYSKQLHPSGYAYTIKGLPLGSEVYVNKYVPHESITNVISVNAGHWTYRISIGYIKNISFKEKKVELKNADSLIYDSINWENSIGYYRAEAEFGAFVFEPNELVSAHPIDKVPEKFEKVSEGFASYIITDHSGKKLMAKEIGAYYWVSPENVKLRLLTGHLIDKFEVLGSSLNKISQAYWEDNFLPIKIHDLLFNVAINSIQNVKIEHQRVTLDFGDDRKVSGTLVGDCEKETIKNCSSYLEVELINGELMKLVPVENNEINISPVRGKE